MIKYMILISTLLGGALLFLLSSNSENTRLFSQTYYLLLGLSGALACFLGGLIAFQFWRLRRKLKAKVFGAKLTLRLVLFFMLVAMVPGFLVYAVSVQFLGKSIESWFDVRVEKALEGGLNLGRSSLDHSLQELARKTQFVGSVLADRHPSEYQHTLDQLVNEKIAQESALFSAKGNLVASASLQPNIKINIPDTRILTKALQQGSYSDMDSRANNSLVLRALVSIHPKNDEYATYILQVQQLVPAEIGHNAETVQAVYQDYQQLALSRAGLKQLYEITLTLSLLLVLLSAVSAAFYLSERIGSSLESLAEGTRAVAQGDFTGQRPIQSRDELGALTGLFNQMTRQLHEAKLASEAQQREVESAKTHLESVLTHLSSGVLSLDPELNLKSANTSASHILSFPLPEMRRQTLQQIANEHTLLASFCQTILQAFSETNNGEWQRQIERHTKNGLQILLLRGTRLPRGGDAGYVVVFDDISHLLQAERQAAWGEVARRLAHEIKNPLTPIQLSAERLQFKLHKKLSADDADLLQRATQTIVNQVEAMKNMVSDFSDYAKAPSTRLASLDLHQLVSEVLALYESGSIRITSQLSAVRSMVNADATRLRQVIHNLLKNAQDALQHCEQPSIILSTETHGREIVLKVDDNGDGFSKTAISRAFEPYMTTKKKGTGLGLAIVKKIIEEHNGHINVENLTQGGASISIYLPLIGQTEQSSSGNNNG